MRRETEVIDSADVPLERRRFQAHLHRDFRPLAHSRTFQGGVHLTSRSSPRASLARTRRRPARPTAERRKTHNSKTCTDVRASLETSVEDAFRHSAVVAPVGSAALSLFPRPRPRPQFLSNRLKSSWRGGTSSRGVPRASRTPRTVSCDPPRTRSPPRRRDTSTCTTR